MKGIVYLFLATALMSAGAQTEWTHELIQDRSFGIDSNTYSSFVNPSGVPSYLRVDPGTGDWHAWRYKTDLNDLYFPQERSRSWAPHINDFGQVAFEAETVSSQHVMVDGHDYFLDVFPPSREHNIAVRGIDNLGRAFWETWRPDWYYVFRGSEELSAGRPVWDITLKDMNRRGDAVWVAREVGVSDKWSVYLNYDNYSLPILGAESSARFQAAINDNGDLLWSGSGANTGGSLTLFLNDVDLGTNGFAADINNSGHMLWVTIRDGQDRLIKDFVDISTPVFGDRPASIYSNIEEYRISENGVALWRAALMDTNERVVYRDSEDLSTDLLGPFVESRNWPETRGVDRWGNCLWFGGGERTGGVNEVFVNRFNLSRDALGEADYPHARALAIGENGHVLWKVQWHDGTQSLFLSTPVPEPSVVLLGAPVLSLVWARRGGARTGRGAPRPSFAAARRCTGAAPP